MQTQSRPRGAGGGARQLPGVRRIALIGSLTTDEPQPKDADLLVTVTGNADLVPLAALGRKLQGHTQGFNRGGEVFLADPEGNYLGRTCPWKQCGPGIRMSCDAWHCGRRHYLHDDFGAIQLAPEVVAAPPLVLWPQTTTRIPMPADVEQRHWLLVVEERKARVVARARGIRCSIIQVLPLQGYLDGKLPEGICLDLMDKIAGEMGTDLAVLHALKAAISALAKERKR